MILIEFNFVGGNPERLNIGGLSERRTPESTEALLEIAKQRWPDRTVKFIVRLYNGVIYFHRELPGTDVPWPQ